MEETAPLEKKSQRSAVQKKLAPRGAKVKAGAAMAGYDSVGHQDAATFKKLNTAALLILAHQRQGDNMKPAAALTAADLPTGKVMTKRLARRVAKLKEAMQAADAPPISPDTPPPKERDDEAESVHEDEMPEESQDDSAHMAAQGRASATGCARCS